MDTATQAEMAAAFRARHREKPILLLPNAWNAMSARIFVAAGFTALATTSGGVAWDLGYPDGEMAPWSEVLDATARIVRSARVPVTADIEAGYAATPEEVAEHVRDIIRTGAIGINLEDGLGGGAIRTLDDAGARIRAARDAASAERVPICINARCDVYHTAGVEEENRFESAVERCRAYIAAGADCVYPFGLRDPQTIAEFVVAVAAPVNVTGRPGMPDAAVLERIGVARITIASAPALIAMSAVQKLAVALRTTGSFETLSPALRHADAQKLFQ